MIYNRDNRSDYRDDEDELWDDELGTDDIYDDSSSGLQPAPEVQEPYPDERRDDYYQDEPSEGTPGDNEPAESSTDYYSEDEEPETTPAPAEKKSLRARLFGPDGDDEDDENDFYENEPEQVPVTKKVKTPKLDPEDPDYWIEEESAIGSIIHKPRKAWIWWLSGSLTALALIMGAWIWWMRPYVDNSVKYGYVKHMERRGSLFRTFEGVLIPYKEIGDPNPLRFEEVRFSVAGDSLATLMKRMMLDCTPVRVEYELYHSPLPWKGKEKMIVTAVDTADPQKIIPPEFR